MPTPTVQLIEIDYARDEYDEPDMQHAGCCTMHDDATSAPAGAHPGSHRAARYGADPYGIDATTATLRAALYGTPATEDCGHTAQEHGYVCAWHGIYAAGEQPPKTTLTVDHLVPQAAGGSDGERNLAWACEDCQRRKGDSMTATTEDGRNISFVRVGIRAQNPDAIAYRRQVAADGRELLAEAMAAFRSYTHHADGWGCITWSLWTFVAQPAFRPYLDHLPVMVVTSTMPGAGKSSVLEVMKHLVPSAVRSNGVSNPTALGRGYANGQWSAAILDEQQTAAVTGNDLRVFLNSTHAPGAGKLLNTPGSEGEWKGEALDYFMPAVIGGVCLDLADDTETRAIWARMRKVSDPGTERIHADDRAILAALGKRIEAWAEEAAPLLAAEPIMPALEPRRRDVWESHYRVAQLLGADALRELGEATTACEAERAAMADEDDAEALAVALFRHHADPEQRGILRRDEYADAPDDNGWVATEHLLTMLRSDDERWADWNARRLADLLKPLAVRPVKRRHDGKQLRGYEVARLWAGLRDHMPQREEAAAVTVGGQPMASMLHAATFGYRLQQPHSEAIDAR